MATTSSSYSGIGFFGLLAVVFIVLKLTEVINWSWWWVLAPMWGGFAIVIACLLVALLFLTIKELVFK